MEKHIITLNFFEDDATGKWGLAHANAIDRPYGNGFNAFWDGLGIFHDLFEHFFEDRHKYFMGDYAFNVGGEMAAMGACSYYYFILNVHNREGNNRSMYSFYESIRNTTENEIHEAITEGSCRYGSTLESNVPRQKPVDCYTLEDSIIDEMWDSVKDLQVTTEYEQEGGIRYKKSVLKSKIANLHRYGFRMAEKLVPDNFQNHNCLSNFIEFWDEITSKNSAEDLANDFKGITFTVTRDGENIGWEAVFNLHYVNDVEEITLNQDSKTVHIEPEYSF